jgi:hypothetical protein
MTTNKAVSRARGRCVLHFNSHHPYPALWRGEGGFVALFENPWDIEWGRVL